ncbi:Phage terminase, large subunit GpA [Pantoea eucalypti]|nr:Phage terminase, large subunit GpA [Pantoea eucalypti]
MLNTCMFFMFNDNSNMAFASSTGKEVKLMKSGKFDNVISRSEVLNQIVTDKNNKNFANNADQTQMIDGSFIYWLNLNAASTLRGKTIKRLFLDEVSNVEADGEEGNPLRLAEQRASTFTDGLVMVASTPKLKDDLICNEYLLSDQRRYFVPCPHCEHEHTLEWENVRFNWRQINGGRRAMPDEDTATLHCPKCDGEISEAQRIRMVKQGRWIATNPEVKEIAGFQISRLYSPITTIRKLVAEYAQAHFEFDLMSFYNNALGLPWDDKMNAELDSVLLENLRDSSFDINNIPDDVLAVTHGIDQQLDRLEVTTVGFSEKNVYVLDHRSFYAPDCTKPGAKAYTELDNFLNATLTTVSGRKVKVLGSFIDSSNGNATATIFRFAGARKNVTAIKGSSSATSDLFKQSRTGGHELLIVKPLMNTYAFDKVLLNPKYFTGKHSVDSFQGDCMNIGFYEGQEPALYAGEMAEWSFYDDVSEVRIIDKYTLFVKGINVVIFLVQQKNKRGEDVFGINLIIELLRTVSGVLFNKSVCKEQPNSNNAEQQNDINLEESKRGFTWRQALGYILTFIVFYNYVVIPILAVFGVVLPTIPLTEVWKVLTLLVGGG